MRRKSTAAPPLLVIVHGVGQQLKLETLRAFVAGCTADLDLPSTYTRAQLADELLEHGSVEVPDLGCAFCEFNYADLIGQHSEYLEQDPRRWIRSFHDRLREMNQQRGGPKDAPFGGVEGVADDVLFATTLARVVANRLKLQTGSVSYAATVFAQQVQLYIDRRAYREEINTEFQACMDALTAIGRARPIHLISHSLGTVVCLRGLVKGAAEGRPWVRRVRRLCTFGSPLDLLLVLFPDLFECNNERRLRIQWTNYTLGNDPIATDLAITRRWVSNHARGLFLNGSPEEVLLGRGSILRAHTDYWHNRSMLQDMSPRTVCGRRAGVLGGEPTGGVDRILLKSSLASAMTSFIGASVLAALFVAGLLILWWEENLKLGNADRLLLGGSPARQSLAWVVAAAAVGSHMYCWSRGFASWLMVNLFICVVSSLALIGLLPPMPVFGQGHAEARPLIESASGPGDLLGGIESAFSSGSAVLLTIPATAIVGVVVGQMSENAVVVSKVRVVLLLGLFTVVLSLSVGTRDNPSNIVPEFALLSLMFAVWWLGILLARIHNAYRQFIQGRRHIDFLARLWGMRGTKRGAVALRSRSRTHPVNCYGGRTGSTPDA